MTRARPEADRARPTEVVFDTSCLSCFARAGRLETLQSIVAGRRTVVPRAVLEELDNGVADHPALADVRSAEWIEMVPVDGLRELRLFAQYVRLLGAGQRDVGESSALAWAEAYEAVAIVDDQTAVNIARQRGVRVRGTLSLIADGIRQSILDNGEAERLIDDLRAGGARFPCTGSEFIVWARDKELL